MTINIKIKDSTDDDELPTYIDARIPVLRDFSSQYVALIDGCVVPEACAANTVEGWIDYYVRDDRTRLCVVDSLTGKLCVSRMYGNVTIEKADRLERIAKGDEGPGDALVEELLRESTENEQRR